jgi:RHS repeat-associated protein
LLTGLGIDQTFSRQVVGGATSSLLTDALGSTIALADSTGSIQTSYTYDPYGAVTQTGQANSNSLQFTGRESDGTTGLDYLRARYYSPGMGRFISQDPLGFPGGPDPNLYGYVWDSPVALTDVLGLDPGNGCGFLGLGCVTNFFKNVWKSIGAPVVHFIQGCIRGAEYGAPAAIVLGIEDPIAGGVVEGAACVMGGVYYIYRPPNSPDIPPVAIAISNRGYGTYIGGEG